jgi:hypothetical protein
MAKTSRAVELT